MTLDYHKLLTGAIIGALSAAGVDLHAYGKAPAGESFNVRKSLARVVSGAIGGAFLAAGLPVAGV